MLKVKKNQIIGFLLFLEAFLLYLFYPELYDYTYSVICAVNFSISIFVFLWVKKKKNYFDFDCLFLTAFFFVTLFYPVFMYESDPTRFFAFLYKFDENVLPQASGLALLGANSYIFGSLMYSRGNIQNTKRDIKVFYIPTRPLYYIAFILFVLFVVTGGYSALAAEYNKTAASKSAISNYILILCPAFLLSGIALDFYNLKHSIKPYKKPYLQFRKTSIIVSFLIAILIILTGSRTIPMQIILVLIGLYTLLFLPISFTKFIITAICGMTALFLLVLMRGYSLGDNQFSIIDLVMDLVVNNRNSYVAVEYVATSGVTFGKSMMGTFFAPVPFLQNLVINVFGIEANQMGSSLIITETTLGEVGDLGMGTNIIADLYMAFGSFGVVIFMGILGFFISYLLANSNSNLYSLVAYTVMLSYSIFSVRAEFFFPFRFLIWTLIIVYLAKQFYLLSHRVKK